jgi:hypothetical protein
MAANTPTLYSVEHLLPSARAALQTREQFSIEEFSIKLFAELERAKVPGVVRAKWPHAERLVYQFDGATFPIELRNGISDVFWYLIRQGYVLPEWGVCPSDLIGTQYRRTLRGTEWAQGGEPMLEDIASYVNRLKQLVPGVDAVVLQYVTEGLSSYNRQLYFASAVMIGAASEKEIYLLGDSLVPALASTAEQTDLAAMVAKGRNLAKLLTFIAKKLGSVTAKQREASNGALDGADFHLMSLLDSIRVQRNDAVHPHTGTCDERTVRMAYESFPGAIEKAEELRRWCATNPNTL